MKNHYEMLTELKEERNYYTKNKSNNEVKEIDGFVLISSIDKDITVDLKYAAADNFTQKTIYPNSVCTLRKKTAEKLANANSQLKKLGYKIKVWDAYRPLYVQKIFWDILPDNRFVANPNTGGSIHNRGCAVDVTLETLSGQELTMPSDFDDFTTAAYRNSDSMSVEAKNNLDLLTKYMTANGFITIDTEWWHFEDTDLKKYEVADIDLDLFLDKI